MPETLTNWSDGVTHIATDLFNVVKMALGMSCVGIFLCLLMLAFRRTKTFGSQPFLILIYVIAFVLAVVLIASGAHFWMTVKSYNVDTTSN